MQTSDPISDILLSAADIIHRDGWCQGQARNEHGNVCLEGAIRTAICGSTYLFSTEPRLRKMHNLQVEALTRVGKVLGGVYWNDCYRWNDRDGRTPDEVVEVLKKAADILVTEGLST